MSRRRPALHEVRARGRRPLRVLLVQLPIQELAFRRVRGNELVAPGYLKAAVESWAAASGRSREVEVEVLPREVVDRLGDAALARAIAAREPDVLGLSLFLWNSARSVALARAAKTLRPELAVVVGGPEVTRDNAWCVTDPGVDLGVVGEGEATFVELVAWLLGGGPAELEKIAGLAIPQLLGVRHTEPRPAIDLARLPSPYLSGAVPYHESDGTVSVETLRGCPFKCTFCYYYKQFAEVNAFPREWLRDHFRFAREHGVRELFFLDPTLNARPHFAEFLDEVIAANETGIDLHAELVADMVDARIADKLQRAGFKGVECGLQTTNPRALAAVNRMCDPERFARGATLLSERGIVVKTDLIIGLPEDDEESCRRSIAWVRDRDVDADVQVFHLMVLPGTELREKADQHGYEHLPRPPYYATRSRWMDEAAMRRLIEHAGAAFELEFDPPARPLLGAPVAPDARVVAEADGWTRVEALEATPESARVALANSAANAVTVFTRSRAAVPFLEEIARANPYATIDVVVPELPVEDLVALKEAAATPAAYLNGYHRFQVEPGALVSTRVSALVEAPRPLEDLEAVVPVTYRVTVRSAADVAKLARRFEGRSLLVRSSMAPGELVAALEPCFEDDRDALYFEDVAAARAWQPSEDAPPEVIIVPETVPA